MAAWFLALSYWYVVGLAAFEASLLQYDSNNMAARRPEELKENPACQE